MMKKYEVCITRDTTVSTVLTIEAETLEIAETEAYRKAEEEDLKWEEDDSRGKPFISWSNRA